MTEDAGALWTASEFVSAVQGDPIGTIGLPITGVSIDSRTLRPGDVFVALHGSERDGTEFAAAALAKGAAAALVARVPEGLRSHGPVIRVDDTLLALERLADAARRRCHACVIGVTGSVGKTGTKAMLATVLAEQAPTHWSEGSYNNHWGVPLTLARLPRNARFAVIELGMNHAGEIARLARLVRPDIAIITTVEPAHLEFFDDLDAIADAKAEIFLGISGAGTAILNRDNAFFDRLCRAADARGVHNIVSFGAATTADMRLVAFEPDETGSWVVAAYHGEEWRYRLAQPGRHVAVNSLAVLAAAAVAGAEIERASVNLAAAESLPGRGLRRHIELPDGQATLIDESYNASPAAMRAAFAVLAQSAPGPGGRRLAVLGDMRELGRSGAELHRDLAVALQNAKCDRLFCCGPLMAHLAVAAESLGLGVTHADTARMLLPAVQAALRPGDVVLVKGSQGSRMADIVVPLTAHAAAGAPGKC